MGNMPGPEHKPNGEPTRLLLSLNAWGASSKADAKSKAASMSVNKGLSPAITLDSISRSKSLAYGMHAMGRLGANWEGKTLARGMAKLDPSDQKIVRRMAVKPVKPDTDDIKTLKASLRSGKKGRKQARDLSGFANLNPSSSYKASGVGKAAAMGSVDKGLPSALRNPNRGLSSPGYTRNRLSANWWGNRASKEIAIKKIPVIQESGVDMRRKIASIKSSKNMGKDHKYDARKDLWRTPVQSSYKKSGVGKSMEYSVDMNQSRFGGASAVGKSFVEKADKAHYADKLLTDVERLAREINAKAPEKAYKQGVRHGMRHNAKVLVPLGAVGGSAATAAGMSAHYRRRREPINVHVVKADEPMYDPMGQPVQQKKRNPLTEMSGNAKLGAAGAGIGLVGAKRMAFAGTLPGALKSQADTAQNRVNFQERMATDQADRVRQASQIRNPITRRRQVNMHSFYADKSAKSLADAEGKKIAADNALKAAPAKRAAHLKSGGALVATGAAMGGLAAYNNIKDRKTKSKVK
jgi:hypothetical protein